MNWQEARESGLGLKASVAPIAVIQVRTTGTCPCRELEAFGLWPAESQNPTGPHGRTDIGQFRPGSLERGRETKEGGVGEA
jgi:hypothetical protein